MPSCLWNLPGACSRRVRGSGPYPGQARRLASLTCARARGATLRRDLIDVAARTARHGRAHITLHLPEGWHREQEWASLFQARPPARPPRRPDQPESGHRTQPAHAGPQASRQPVPVKNHRTSGTAVSGRKTTPTIGSKIAFQDSSRKAIIPIHAVDGMTILQVRNCHRRWYGYCRVRVRAIVRGGAGGSRVHS